ncbi:hypothetical protein C4565_00120, partial [Candidatus Parcubacteria bacterium]
MRTPWVSTTDIPSRKRRPDPLNGRAGKISREDFATRNPDRQEPRHALLVLPVRLPELPEHPALLEKGADVEIGDDGRRRGGAVSRLDGVKGEQQRAPEVEGVAHQAVPLSGEEAIVGARRLPSSFPPPFPLAQTDELLQVPRRPQEQARPEELHPVEEEADPTVEAVEGEVREGADVKERRGRGGGGIRRKEEPVARPD